MIKSYRRQILRLDDTMLDIAWPELLVIGAVALVVIGPKDLPKVMHQVGEWAGKARRMVHELQRGFEQLSYESEVADKIKQKEQAPIVSTEGASPPLPSDHTKDHDRPTAA